MWEVRKVIPSDLRSALGKTEFKQALNTRDENEAVRFAGGLLADWNQQIEAARATTVLAVAPVQRAAISRGRAYDAIKRWETSRIANALDLGFNAMLDPPPVGFSDEMAAHVRMVGDLKNGDWTIVPDFDARLSAALNQYGIMCDPLHPAIPAMRPWFCEAMATVEKAVMEYRRGRLSEAPPAPPESLPTIVVPESNQSRPASSQPTLKIMDAFETWVSVTGKKKPERLRGYFNWLVSFVGDKPMADVDANDLDRFWVQLRRFPNTKKDLTGLSFAEVIAKFESSPDCKPLVEPTVYKWAAIFKQLWTYAHSRKQIPDNPMIVAMPKRPTKTRARKRKEYDPADIAAIFSTPLFQGTAKALSARGKRYGYSEKPGAVIVKDAHYWLPIFALWHGIRLEEIGGARVSELKLQDGRWAFDWTERELKNDSSARLLPIHRKLIELGFVEYVKSLPENGFVFPELAHDPEDEEAATRQFSKWWGFWTKANAEVRGHGFDDPLKVFHSFRHSFHTACRGKVDREMQDRLTGHVGQGGVGQNYGSTFFATLVEAIDKIDYPTFPKLA